MTKYVNEWLEELLCSSRNIEILAESSLGVIGKGDEDLRMREMTPEEGESLKEYTRVTEGLLAFKRYMNVSYKTFHLLPFIFRFLKTIFFFLGSSFCFIIKRCCTISLYPLPLQPERDDTRKRRRTERSEC